MLIELAARIIRKGKPRIIIATPTIATVEANFLFLMLWPEEMRMAMAIKIRLVSTANNKISGVNEGIELFIFGSIC